MATQMVLMDTDAVEVSYADGCRLELSPCGSTFLFHRPEQGRLHPLHDQNRIQQRTAFTTSEFRDQVAEALDFRNRFAQCPFICQHVQQELKYETLHVDIQQVSWPKEVEPSNVSVLPDGSLKVTSVDQYASITLAPNRCYFTVEYLAKTSQPLQKNRHKQSTGASGEKGSNGGQSSRSVSCASGPVTSQHQDIVTTKTSDHLTQEKLINQENHSYLSSIPNTSESATPRFHEESGSLVLDCDRSGAESRDLSQNSHDSDNGRWVYAWMVQYHSVQEYPESWAHPLKLLMDSKTSDLEYNEHKKDHPTVDNVGQNHSKLISDLMKVHKGYHGDCCKVPKKAGNPRPHSSRKTDKNTKTPKESENQTDSADVIWTSLPRSLPLMCPAPHLHKWKQDSVIGVEHRLGDGRGKVASMLGRIKVVCTHGVIYRLLWNRPRGIEIYPGDGSIMKSSGVSGHFFQHYICQHGQVEERMYSVQSPPPHCPDLPYSVAKLVTSAARFLDNLHEESVQLSLTSETICWMQTVSRSPHDIMEPQSRQLLEECFTPGLGKFTAFTSGHLRAVFADRTCADMWVDLDRKQHPTESDNNQVSTAGLVGNSSTHLLPHGVCQLLLPNGHYKLVNIQDPGEYMKYTQAMQNWARWVRTPPGERANFYKDTVYDQEKISSIQQELQKIRCFNFLLENTVVNRVAEPCQKEEKQTPSSSLPSARYHPMNIADEDTDNHMNPVVPLRVTNECHSSIMGTAYESGQLPETFNMTMVQEALQKTSQHIQALDKLLNK